MHSPQRQIEQFEEAVGKAEVAEAEAGRVPGKCDPALVVDVGADGGDSGRRHLLEEALRAGSVEAVDRIPAVLLRAKLHRLDVLVAVLADLRR